MTQPPIPSRRNVGPKLKKELEVISEKLADALARKAAAAKDEATLKVRIKEIAASYDLPFSKGASQYLNVPAIDRALRITRPEVTPVIDPDEFLAEVGVEMFHRVVQVLKVELRLTEWLKAVEDELVTEAALSNSIKQADPDAADPITIALATTFDPKNAS